MVAAIDAGAGAGGAGGARPWRCWRCASAALSLCTTLLREQLGFRVNSMILEKALTLDLEHFEDSEFYDRMTRARREASAAAAVAGDAQLLAGAEPDLAGELCGAAVPLFAVGRGAAGRRRPAGVHR